MNGWNLCTPRVYVSPEADGTRGVKVEFECIKGGMSVRACRWYRPMTGPDGEPVPGECHYFNEGCACDNARRYALRRARRIIKESL